MRPRTTPMTADELRKLPAAVDLPTAARALNLGRTGAYSMAKRGDFPVPLLRMGSQYRARRADLLALLGVADTA